MEFFYKYTYGHKFSLVTDHRQLITIFGPKTIVPSLVAAGLQHWALILAGYSEVILMTSSIEKVVTMGMQTACRPSWCHTHPHPSTM